MNSVDSMILNILPLVCVPSSQSPRKSQRIKWIMIENVWNYVLTMHSLVKLNVLCFQPFSRVTDHQSLNDLPPSRIKCRRRLWWVLQNGGCYAIVQNEFSIYPDTHFSLHDISLKWCDRNEFQKKRIQHTPQGEIDGSSYHNQKDTSAWQKHYELILKWHTAEMYSYTNICITLLVRE